MASTIVTNLATGDKASYSLPPAEAVVAVHEFFTRRNKNTWTYQKPADHPAFVRSNLTVSCGDWCCLIGEPTLSDVIALQQRATFILEALNNG